MHPHILPFLLLPLLFLLPLLLLLASLPLLYLRLDEIQKLLVVDDELADRLGAEAISRRIDRNQVPSRDDLRDVEQHIVTMNAELGKRKVSCCCCCPAYLLDRYISISQRVESH